MAMAQFAGSTSGSASAPSASSSSASRPADVLARRGPPPNAGGRSEIQLLLSKFDVMINQMQDYPAKDTINSLTMLAESVQFAPDIVSFLETKIHRAPPNYKLPIFYLTDSILKNVGGPYPSLFSRVIVPLYCNCVRQVSSKDLRRFVHVLNTWEMTRLFPVDAIAQMRAAANRALAVVDPSAGAQPVSFSQQQPSASQSRFHGGPAPSGPSGAQQQDMELRSLLTKLQNDMGIHPTEHMSLEEVRTNNPDYYNQLLEFHAESKAPPAPAPVAAPPGQGILPLETAKPISRPVRGDPRRASPTAQAPVVVKAKVVPTPARPAAPAAPAVAKAPAGGGARPEENGSTAGAPTSSRASGNSDSTGKSANVAHLMQLLKRKQHVPPPAKPHELNEITNDAPTKPTPDAAAVMSILQKLKGMTKTQTEPSASSQAPPPAPVAPVAPPSRPPPPPPLGPRPGSLPPTALPPPPPQVPAQKSDNASRMWFSDKIIAHKDRVESNVQKLYAALPLVCRESGLRFREQSKLDAHLDFLFQYNRAQKERGKGGVSRSWYPDEEQWVTDFASDKAPRESTSSSFFDRKESEDEAADSWESASVPVDESITRCHICGENFSRSWDEDEEDWMYTNAVIGTIRHDDAPDEKTIFHKYCYDTVMANSSCITPEHLIPMTPQQSVQSATDDVRELELDQNPTSGPAVGEKRAIEQEDSDSDEDDIKRVRTE